MWWGQGKIILIRRRWWWDPSDGMVRKTQSLMTTATAGTNSGKSFPISTICLVGVSGEEQGVKGNPPGKGIISFSIGANRQFCACCWIVFVRWVFFGGWKLVFHAWEGLQIGLRVKGYGVWLAKVLRFNLLLIRKGHIIGCWKSSALS